MSHVYFDFYIYLFYEFNSTNHINNFSLFNLIKIYRINWIKAFTHSFDQFHPFIHSHSNQFYNNEFMKVEWSDMTWYESIGLTREIF